MSVGSAHIYTEETVRRWTSPCTLNSLITKLEDTDGLVTKINEEQDSYTATIDAAIDLMNLSGVTKDISLDNFLARPILIQTYPWAINTSAQFDLVPLRDFILNSYVAEKVNRFAYISGTVHVKFTCTGTMFHYGKAIAALCPWPNLENEGLYVNQLSQLPYIVIDPNTATGGTLEIPFMYPRNGVPIARVADSDETYAKVYVRTINDLLVMGDTTTGVSIQAYIWMTNVKFIMPTCGTLNSEIMKDVTELGTTAMEIATKSPVIGKYARASRIAMKAGKDIAAEFGYSRPNKPIVEARMLPQQTSNLANMNVFDISPKLSMDAQQEVYVDGKSIGATNDDDMFLTNIVTRESLIYTVDWTDSTLTTEPLFRTGVTPSITVEGTNEYVQTPSSHVANCFSTWRGSMIFRIEIVATPFHRGKLKITYDPLNDFNSTSGFNELNLSYSQIIDLSTTRNYEFCIGWGTNRPFLNTTPINFINFTVDPTDTLFDPLVHNGVLTISQLAPLTAGILSPGGSFGKVYVNIYARSADDMIFASPTAARWAREARVGYATFNAAPLQLSENPGGNTKPGGADLEICLNESPMYYNDGTLTNIHYGENISSLRQLLKRYMYSETLAVDLNTTSARNLYRYIDASSDIPVFRTADNEYLNTFINWFYPSFAGFKGGTRWKYLVHGPIGNWTLQSIVRNPIFQPSRGSFLIGDNLSAASIRSGFAASMLQFGYGGTLTMPLLQPMIEAELPYYSSRKFIPIKTLRVNEDTGGMTNTMFHNYQIYYNGSTVTPTTFIPIHKFVAVADDFSFFFYRFGPVVKLNPV